MQQVAFHRTTAENAARIVREGIKSFATRGLSLTVEEGKPSSTWDNDRQALINAGFKFRIPTASGAVTQPMGLNSMFDASHRARSTFVRKGGVEVTWARDGVTVAVDMSKVDATLLADDFGSQCWCDCPETHTDEDGEVNHGCHGWSGTDWQVCGDVPASAVMGVVSDAWMTANGFEVKTGNDSITPPEGAVW
tara:strand:+ start:3838 stop:4416 length:579 start_codon:yes stop_codon:yes gene_type:complete